MVRIRFHLRGPARLWVASSVFCLLGILMAGSAGLIVPAEPAEDAAIVKAVLWILGGVFFGLGLFTLGRLAIGRYLEQVSPQNLPVFHWWVNLAGGLLGALVFAIPASLAYPLILMIPDDPQADKNRLIGLLFSLLGVVVLLATVAAAWVMIRNRPRWRMAEEQLRRR